MQKFFFFFFSSRRRHTRLQGDWSSDVCSSDWEMAEARAMDERVARREEVGALAGVPIGVKDLEEVAGMATTFGSQAFRDNLAVEDAIEVARLRAAGAIVIGKTN